MLHVRHSDESMVTRQSDETADRPMPVLSNLRAANRNECTHLASSPSLVSVLCSSNAVLQNATEYHVSIHLMCMYDERIL